MMTGYQSIEFHETLDMLESLPTTQQESLIGIIRRRLVESRRDSISHNIRAAKEEHAKGDARTGTVDELMKELKMREADPQPTPSLTDLCNVGGEGCFSNAEEVDEYIRDLRDEWP
uniref:Uncharacterized protein n=1 Tax=Candidatus Kentrum sp. UNK TaxID=2126344 RepID=A0A451AX33_9GAMM|nr:MAG: hypothetical protein BECKUNK1418G_GA0071005_102511 [Candidatus Kentron sp. UNK]VFK70542.1 MAG: hypothetical protein BECKUNK1418H_GA0071006_103117 [Candidatus Kentron sp. UNK]